MADFARFL